MDNRRVRSSRNPNQSEWSRADVGRLTCGLQYGN